MKMLTEAQLYAMLCAAYDKGWDALASECDGPAAMHAMVTPPSWLSTNEAPIDKRGRFVNEQIRNC